jgi:hypothetical protein
MIRRRETARQCSVFDRKGYSMTTLRRSIFLCDCRALLCKMRS